VRFGLFAVSPRRQVVCFVAHHIVIDAMSLRVLVAELGQAYEALASHGEAPDLPPPATLPANVISDDSVRFWQAHVSGHDSAGMRLDGARDATGEPSFAGELVERMLSEPAVRALVELRRRCRATDALVLLSAYYLTLYGYGADSDALVGVITDTRGGSAGDAIGYHLATLPLRVALAADRAFVDVRATALAALAESRDPGAASLALRYAKVGVPYTLRREAVRALGAAGKGNAEALDALSRQAASGTFPLRAAAVDALAELGDKRALDTLRAIAADDRLDGRLRSGARSAIRRIESAK
jgi:hypothetical protein